MLFTQTSNIWQFGLNELIALISAFATFSAVIVSLYLALKAKTIKYKVLINHEMAGLRIANVGDSKFLINAFGIYTNKEYYLDSHERFCKVLCHSKKISEHSTTFQEISCGYVILEPGDVVEVALESFDYSLAKSNTYLFICISGKLKKYKLYQERIKTKARPQMEYYSKYKKEEIKNIGFYIRN